MGERSGDNTRTCLFSYPLISCFCLLLCVKSSREPEDKGGHPPLTPEVSLPGHREGPGIDSGGCGHTEEGQRTASLQTTRSFSGQVHGPQHTAKGLAWSDPCLSAAPVLTTFIPSPSQFPSVFCEVPHLLLTAVCSAWNLLPSFPVNSFSAFRFRLSITFSHNNRWSWIVPLMMTIVIFCKGHF